MVSTIRIEISGGIASGKTTLAGLFEDERAVTFFEDFKVNPFWEQFYEDPKRFAFETEVTFLLQHYNQIKATSGLKEPIVCDFSFLLDRAYVDVTLSDNERRVFLTVFEEVRRQLGPPALYVLLECSPEEELRRIKARGRETEKSMEIEYLARLNTALACHVEMAESSSRILRIDSEHRNFAKDAVCQTEVVAEIKSAFAHIPTGSTTATGRDNDAAKSACRS